jgi:archaellum biogenesis ATPase FlaH
MNSDIRMVEVATGHVSNRSQVIMLNDINNYVFETKDKTETYHSWYAFDEQLDQHIKACGTIQGYNGVYYINNIILDYDRKKLSNQGLYDSVHFLINEEMINDMNIKPEHILVWYSGTGFHIEIPDIFGFTPSTTLPSIVKETLTSIFPNCDSIYDGARLIRAGFSYNAKSGNFKLPFTVEQFNKHSIEDILALSSDDKSVQTTMELFDHSFLDRITDPYMGEYIKFPKLSDNRQVTVRTEFRTNPNSVVSCMQKLLGNNPEIGERNQSMMRIGSWMRRSGMPYNIVLDTLSQWSGLTKEAEHCTKSIFDIGYEYSCEDYIMSKYCQPNCIYFKHKDYNLNIMSAKDCEDKYVEFLKTDFTKKAFNFSDVYSLNHDWWVYPGELVIVTGNTGLGKSTFVMNLIAKLPHMRTMFCALENSYLLTHRRFCQITHSLDKNKVMADYKWAENEGTPINFSDAWKHVNILCEPPELGKLKESIARSQPRIVVIDTTDMIWVKGYHDEIGKMNEIINSLKALAQSQECIVIAVHHVNKEAMKEGISTITSLKGTTNVVQKADKVIAINGDINERMRSVHSEKARDEGFMRMMFHFNKDTFVFEQVDETQGFANA